MDREQRQHEYEKKWAQALLDYINSKEESDYIAVKPSKQPTKWSDIDIEAKSPSGKHSSLYLQLTRDDRLDPEAKAYGVKFPVFNCDNILQAISEKVAKYTKSGKDFSQITLVVQGTLIEESRKFELTPELYDECKKYPFSSIYYISAPSVSNYGGENHHQGWFIDKLK